MRLEFVRAFLAVAVVAALAACQKPADPQPPQAHPMAAPPLDASASIAMLSQAIDRLDFDTATRVIHAAKALDGTQRRDFSSHLQRQWARPPPGDQETEAIRIRLEVANYLLQDTKNRRIAGATAPYLTYARAVVQAPATDNLNRSAALIVLWIGGEAQDLDTFRHHLNAQDKWVADAAALGLAGHCDVSEADAAEIGQAIASERQRAYFNDAWRRFAPLRQHCA